MPTTAEIRRELDATEFSLGMIHGVDCSCSQCCLARYCRLLCDELDAAKGEYPKSPEERDENIRRFEAARRAREEEP